LVSDCLDASSSTSRPSVLHGAFDTSFAVVLPRVALIMSTAAQAKILNRALAPRRPRLNVVEL
jgi:hypothetical protein